MTDRNLLQACINENYELLDDLIESDADINIYDIDGSTPLIIACNLCNVQIVKKLLQTKKCNIDTQTIYGWSPLMISCYKGYLPIIDLLMDEKVDVNLQNNEGWTALMIACAYSYSLVLDRLLLSTNIQTQIKNIDGLTAMQIALSSGKSTLVIKLLHHDMVDA